jgi:hypothetical protein
MNITELIRDLQAVGSFTDPQARVSPLQYKLAAYLAESLKALAVAKPYLLELEPESLEALLPQLLVRVLNGLSVPETKIERAYAPGIMGELGVDQVPQPAELVGSRREVRQQYLAELIQLLNWVDTQLMLAFSRYVYAQDEILVQYAQRLAAVAFQELTKAYGQRALTVVGYPIPIEINVNYQQSGKLQIAAINPGCELILEAQVSSIRDGGEDLGLDLRPVYVSTFAFWKILQLCDRLIEHWPWGSI